MDKSRIKYIRVTKEQEDELEKVKERYHQESIAQTIRMIIEDFISQEKQRNIVNKGFKK